MTATRRTIRRGSGNGQACAAARGFTLFELLIVVGIIILVLTITLPPMMSMLTSGADAQAYNLLSGQLMVARSVAMENGTHVAVHVQMGQAADVSDGCFSAVTWIAPGTTNTTFSLASGYSSNRMPGTLAFGEISADFVNGSDFDLTPGLGDFTAFSILFNARGEVVKKVDGGGTIVFDDDALTGLVGDGKLWSSALANGEDGIWAVTLFDYSKLVSLTVTADREAYLGNNAQLLPVNTYTGRLFSRK